VAVSGVTLRNGHGSWGAGVQVDGPAVFTLTHSVVASNTSSAGGGGVYVQYLSARTTISDCAVVNNRTGAGLNSHGGGIAVSEGRLTLINSTVLSNSTDYKGGGIYVAGVSNLLTVEGSTVVSNTAGGNGGGIFSEVGTMILRHSTVISNVSGNLGGGIFSNSNSGFSDTTIAGNRGYKSGGIHNQNRLYLTNVTVSANEASDTAGAIYNVGNGDLIVRNSTIVYNTYIDGSAGGIYNYADVSLESTIVAHNEGADCTDMGGTFTSEGYNLEYGHTCVLTATGDITDTDPLLGPLQDNGGDALTHALLVGSLAIDHGSFSYPSTDQRGVPRPQGSRCDIGAYERGAAALAIAKRGPDQVPAGEPITYTLAVTNTGYEVVEGLVITDVLPEGAHYVGGGMRVGNVVSWTLPGLAWWGENAVGVQFAVTATETITNADYRVSAAGGVGTVGETPVVTTIYEAKKIYLPFVIRDS
jgi:fibronectin-binding autotransporter adhesin